MPKLIMWNLVTLDGFFEGAQKWQLDFHGSAWGPELEKFAIDQLKDADRLVFGRVTYEGMAAYWKKEKGEIAGFMNAIPKTVFSRTLKSPDWNNTTLASDPVAEISALKRSAAKDVFVFGSADLSASLLEHNLYDELRICFVPVLIGQGTPLFKRANAQHKFTLAGSQTLSNGSVIHRYALLR